LHNIKKGWFSSSIGLKEGSLSPWVLAKNDCKEVFRLVSLTWRS